MKLLKAGWVNHDGKPIFSIDIHPDGSRFATGGQGDNSGQVIVWNFAPVRDEDSEKNEKVPKMLCKMENHLGCVNSVRWSNNGRYLASGGDDKLVMIWQISRYGGSSGGFGSEGQFTNVEHWRVANILRGHTEDVLDLAWSPNDVWMASCSVDNTVIVWNARKFPEQVAMLKGHTGLVKGVCWDPVGKYLASQSDDKSVRVWRTRDWQEEGCVTEPFQECGGTTHVLRLNWSPDGAYIVSAHAMNNSGPTAQIIERSGWKTSLDFVGHRKAITCVRFNPNVLKKKIKKTSEKSQQYTCCAIGSRDRSISVWLTALKRPLVVNHDLFKSSILDISWSASGMELMCCSADGSVAYMSFSCDEIGKPMPKEEKMELFRKMYGKNVVTMLTDAAPPTNHIIESSAMLTLQQEAKQRNEEEVKERQDSSSQQTPRKSMFNPPLQTPTKQIETRTKDGKRRIIPIFLAPQGDIGETPKPFTVSEETPMFSSSKEQSCIVREKVESVSPPAGGIGGQSQSQTPKSQQSGPPTSESKETPGNITQNAPGELPSSAEKHTPPVTKPSEKHHKFEKDKFKLSVKRKLESSPSSGGVHGPIIKKKDGRGRPRKDKARENVTPRSTPLVTVVPTPTPVIEKETRIIYTNSGLNLSVPSLEKTASVQIPGLSEGRVYTVEIENEVTSGGSGVRGHRVRCVEGGTELWENVTVSQCIALVANKQVVCTACENQSVQVYSSTSGCKLLPSLILDSRVHKLRATGYYVMVITAKGALFVWNLQTKQADVKNESLVSIVPDDKVKIDKCTLTDQGLPVISLNTGNTYTYKHTLATWVSLGSKSDLLHLSSDHQGCVPIPQSQLTGPLSVLQHNTHKGASLASRMYKTGSRSDSSSTLSHLENQVSCALALRSGTEYHFWFMTYVRYLVQEGVELRLREVCDDLLGPLHKSKSSNWENSVLGYKKRSVLQECLPIIGSNLSLQRLYTEYKEQLDSVLSEENSRRPLLTKC